ncbi:MAG: hypothetical protein CM1200mP21_01700 [Candidatus Poseidoniales archaeon]|nr:MAG: hypothetical protein CM1200mP21_01700 [Candidatus Poseidoniales archaeon]
MIIRTTMVMLTAVKICWGLRLVTMVSNHTTQNRGPTFGFAAHSNGAGEGITTTDIRGSGGYNGSGNITHSFGGTSRLHLWLREIMH